MRFGNSWSGERELWTTLEFTYWKQYELTNQTRPLQRDFAYTYISTYQCLGLRHPWRWSSLPGCVSCGLGCGRWRWQSPCGQDSACSDTRPRWGQASPRDGSKILDKKKVEVIKRWWMYMYNASSLPTSVNDAPLTITMYMYRQISKWTTAHGYFHLHLVTVTTLIVTAVTTDLAKPQVTDKVYFLTCMCT